MVVERDAEHVVDFALVPVGVRPDAFHGVNRRVVFVHLRLEAQPLERPHGIQVVDDFKARLVVGHDVQPIHSGDVGQVVVVRFRRCRAASLADADDVVLLDGDRLLAAEQARRNDGAGELLLDQPQFGASRRGSVRPIRRAA